MKTEDQIVIYTSPDNHTEVTVKMQDDTVWLTQAQMAELFDTTKQNISLHMKNVFSDGELIESSVVKDFLTTASDGKNYQTQHYNLDAIISIGYRVNTKRGTAFRIWATQRLREYLVQGYSINQKRLDELQKTIQIISEKSKGDLSLVEARGFLEIISTYTESFILLNQYDAGSLEIEGSPDITYIIEYNEAHTVIGVLRNKLMEQ